MALFTACVPSANQWEGGGWHRELTGGENRAYISMGQSRWRREHGGACVAHLSPKRRSETRGNSELGKLLFRFGFVDKGESAFGLNAHETVPLTKVPLCHSPAETPAHYHSSQHGLGALQEPACAGLSQVPQQAH